LENKLELLIEKEALEFLDEQIQVMENGTITYPIHVKAQEDANPFEKKSYRYVGVQMEGTPSVHTNRSSSINQPTSMRE
jgi:hypothetical protein